MSSLFLTVFITLAILMAILFITVYEFCRLFGRVGGIIVALLYSGLTWTMLGMGFLLCIEPEVYPYLCETKEYELVQAAGDSKLEGQFYFHRGYVHEKDVYEYYYKDGDKIRKNYIYVNNPNTYIVETDGVPHVELQMKATCKKWGWWRRNFLTEELRYKTLGHQGVLYVPKGTIIPNKFDGLNL